MAFTSNSWLCRPAGILLLATCPLWAGEKSKGRSTGASDRAIHYRLPKNYFQFQFQLKQTTTLPGPYCDVARYFFDVAEDFPKNSPCETEPGEKKPSRRYRVTLGDQVTVTQLAEPDPGNAFDFIIPKGAFNESNLVFGFGDGGMLTSSQLSSTNHKVDFVFSILKAVGSVAAPITRAVMPAPPPPVNQVAKLQKEEPESLETTRRPARAAPPQQAAHEDCSAELDEQERALLQKLGSTHREYACRLNASLRSEYLKVPEAYKSYIDAYEKENHSFDLHFAAAIRLFEEYSRLAEDDAEFFRPERFPVNSDAFTAISKAREQKMNQIRQQFLGWREDSVIAVPLVTWRFKNDGENGVELFSFDATAEGGFCFDSSVADGRWFARPLEAPECKADSLIHVYADLSKDSIENPAATLNIQDAGQWLAYYVPGRGTLRLYAKDQKGSSSDYVYRTFDIAQFGKIMYLPSRLGNSTTANVALDPITGALKSVAVGVKPLLTGDMAKQIGDISGSVPDFLEALKAAKKKPTELEDAQSQEALKLEQLKIQLIDSCKSDPNQPYCGTLLQ